MLCPLSLPEQQTYTYLPPRTPANNTAHCLSMSPDLLLRHNLYPLHPLHQHLLPSHNLYPLHPLHQYLLTLTHYQMSVLHYPSLPPHYRAQIILTCLHILVAFLLNPLDLLVQLLHMLTLRHHHRLFLPQLPLLHFLPTGMGPHLLLHSHTDQPPHFWICPHTFLQPHSQSISGVTFQVTRGTWIHPQLLDQGHPGDMTSLNDLHSVFLFCI